MKVSARNLIASLEAAPVGDGDLLGQPFLCLPYQRKFLQGAFRPGVMRAGLSLARGGGKTGLASALALDSVRPGGELHVPGGETILVASSFSQAKICFEAIVLAAGGKEARATGSMEEKRIGSETFFNNNQETPWHLGELRCR